MHDCSPGAAQIKHFQLTSSLCTPVPPGPYVQLGQNCSERLGGVAGISGEGPMTFLISSYSEGT